MYIGRLMCEDSFAINPPLLLQYCEAIKNTNAIGAFMETSS